MMLAAEEINKLGGIRGRMVEVVVVDAESSLETARQGFDDLETAEKPIAYVTASSSMAMALAPLAEEHQVPLLGLITTTPEFSLSNEWCFRYWTSSELLLQPAIKVLKRIGVKELAVLYQDDQLGNSVVVVLRPRLETMGLKVAAVPFGMRVKDFAPTVSDLLGTEALYLVGFSGKVKSLLREIRRQSYAGHVLTVSSGSDPAVRSIPEADGIYTIAPRIYGRDFPFSREISARYEARFEKPIDHRSASGYDAVKLLGALLEKTDLERDALRAALAGGFIYPGLFGDIDVPAGSRDFLLPMDAARTDEGELVFLE